MAKYRKPSKSKRRKLVKKLKMKNLTISDPKIQKFFKSKTSSVRNYVDYFLAANPNASVDKNQGIKVSARNIPVEPAKPSSNETDAEENNGEQNDLIKNEVLKALLPEKKLDIRNEKNPQFPSEHYRTIIEELIQKHGDNHKAMFMDIKVNIYQWTVKQIQRQIKLYHEYLEWKKQLKEFKMRRQSNTGDDKEYNELDNDETNGDNIQPNDMEDDDDDIDDNDNDDDDLDELDDVDDVDDDDVDGDDENVKNARGDVRDRRKVIEQKSDKQKKKKSSQPRYFRTSKGVLVDRKTGLKVKQFRF